MKRNNIYYTVLKNTDTLAQYSDFMNDSEINNCN